MSDSSALVVLPTSGLVMAADYLCLAVLVLDRSSSMVVHGGLPLREANKCLDQLSKDANAEHIAAAIVSFSSDFTVEIPPTAILQAPRLKSYLANGCTKLYLTVSATLNSLREFVLERETRGGRTDIIVHVLTDGEDSDRNAKVIATLKVQSMDARLRDWQLRVFGFGSGADGQRIAQEMGFIDGDAQTSATPDASVACGGYNVDATEDGMDEATQTTTGFVSRTTRMGLDKNRRG